MGTLNVNYTIKPSVDGWELFIYGVYIVKFPTKLEAERFLEKRIKEFQEYPRQGLTNALQ